MESPLGKEGVAMVKWTSGADGSLCEHLAMSILVKMAVGVLMAPLLLLHCLVAWRRMC